MLAVRLTAARMPLPLSWQWSGDSPSRAHGSDPARCRGGAPGPSGRELPSLAGASFRTSLT